MLVTEEPFWITGTVIFSFSYILVSYSYIKFDFSSECKMQGAISLPAGTKIASWIRFEWLPLSYSASDF